MSEPFIGQISIVAFPFAPKGWALCNGQLLPINQNQALFSLLGTTFGGDGRTNFGLPNFQGRTPAGAGNGMAAGESAGQYGHTLTVNEMPNHLHAVMGSSTTGDTTEPNGALFATDSSVQVYSSAAPDVSLSAGQQPAGGSQPHNNLQPYLTMNFIIALVGIYPSRN